VFPVFHTSEIEPYVENNPNLFPDRELPRPGPIVTTQGQEEWQVEEIIDERKRGDGHQYLVRWTGHGTEDEQWLPGAQLHENTALDEWEARKESELG
jgi:hypothetical protein